MWTRRGESPVAIKNMVREHAVALGFDAVGFASAVADDRDRRNLDAFIAQGRQGGMAWMGDTAERRVDPSTLWPEARSVICVGMNYGPALDPLAPPGRPDRGAISVYAQGRDYHDVMKKRLKSLARWLVETAGGDVKVFVDTAPVMEKPLAMRAGLGWQGKHTNLVSRRFGSWLFLGELFTTLELEPDPPESDRCGSCTRCLEACPTGALTGPYRMDARRCISYLTIEHKDEIAEETARRMGNRIYGCDDCLAVCPWNKFARPTRESAFFPFVELTAPRLGDLAGLDDADFRRVFAGSPVKRTGRDRLVRNVLVAMGNSAVAGLAPRARALEGDEAPLVRSQAERARARLERA